MSVLLKKIITDEIKNSVLVDTYHCILKHSDFNTVINKLKETLDYEYDFTFLTSEAKKFETNRKELRGLLESLSEMLGEKINDIAEEINFVSPSRFEDYCPFPREEKVLYTNRRFEIGDLIQYDGNTYTIIDKKLESTPYYEIYCYRFER